MMDHIGPEKVGADWELDGAGHDHPHRGFETLTFMFEGKMNHRDSLGNKATLQNGSVQRMNAGSGIIHGGSMYSDQKTERFHEMQLWINSPQNQKMSDPEIQNISNRDFPVIETNGIKLKVISGQINTIYGPMQTFASTQIGHLTSDRSASIDIGSFQAQANVMVYVLEGGISIDNQTVVATELTQLSDEGSAVKIDLFDNSQALVLAGIPLNEPVVFGGPFVMNTQEEIEQANIDFQKGKFGSISSDHENDNH